MNDFFSDPALVFWTILGAAYIIYLISSAFEKDKSPKHTRNDQTYTHSKPDCYPQKQNSSNDLDPVMGKAIDLLANSLKRDKTGMEFIGGALQGDFSTQKVSAARVGAAVAAGLFAIVAASAKVSETTTRAEVGAQFEFGKKKLEDGKNNTFEESVPNKDNANIIPTHGKTTGACQCSMCGASNDWTFLNCSRCGRDRTYFIPGTSKNVTPDSVIAQGAQVNGRGYLNENRFDEAIVEFSRAITCDPNDDYNYYSRGWAYASQGNLDKAIADFTSAIQLNSQEAEYYECRGAVHGEQKNWEKAIADYSSAIGLNAQDPSCYNNRGNAYASQENWEKAIADYSSAIELNAQDQNFYINRGGAYFHQENWEKAISDFTNAILINPQEPGLYFFRGRTYLAQMRLDDAIADFNTVNQFAPEEAEGYYYMALALENAKRFGAAIEYYRRYLQHEQTENQELTSDVKKHLAELTQGLKILSEEEATEEIDHIASR